MLKPERILFPTDFSEGSDRAFQYAEQFCGLFDSSLHILHANLSPPDMGAEKIDYIPIEEKKWSEDFRSYMDSLTSASLKAHAVVKREIAGISAAEVILRYAREHDIDLIVLGTHGRRGLGRLLLGSTAEEVSRLSECSVLTVGGKSGDAKPININRVLVPVDFSEYSDRALVEAKELAGVFEAKLDVVHVLQQVAMPSSLGITIPSIATPEVHARAKEALEKAVRDTQNAEVFVVDGLPAQEITRLAQEIDSDLIVMATHGLTGFEHFLMGSVTERVLRLSPCPVFTVKNLA